MTDAVDRRRIPALVALVAAMTLGACANEPMSGRTGFVPASMLRGPDPVSSAAEPVTAPADPVHELSRKSLAAKVLASRALEAVTGLKTDPARLSEHD